MGINIRQKGANGEREIYNTLNPIIQSVMKDMGFPDEQVIKAANCVQRNQNQTAVGGNDLVNCFGLSIEVKRQEQLSVNTWWVQCRAAAERNSEIPVLIYRQNHKSWRVVTYGFLPLPDNKQIRIRAEFCWEEFLMWFTQHVTMKLKSGYQVRL